MKGRIALSIVSIGVFVALATGSSSGEQNTATPVGPNPGAGPGAVADPVPAAPPEPAAEDQLPWVAQVRENCSAYDAAPNEIRKSAIFRENHTLVTSQRFSDVRGQLVRLSTTQGGGSVTLTVDVGEANFATDFGFSIRQGSRVYQQAEVLAERQCVIFSARIRSENSVAERSKVCDLDYFVEYTSIVPCEADLP